MKKKPTQAPWKWVDDQLLSETEMDENYDIPRGRRIIETDGGHYPPFGPDRKLIAAAPALLEALEKYREAFLNPNRVESMNQMLEADGLAELAIQSATT